jgi:hypothetical protein
MSATLTHSPRIARRAAPSGQPPVTARRRKIDPTTCERDYGPEELEFMRAIEAYKRSSGRLFPTCSEVLEVVRSLGYRRPDMP